MHTLLIVYNVCTETLNGRLQPRKLHSCIRRDLIISTESLLFVFLLCSLFPRPTLLLFFILIYQNKIPTPKIYLLLGAASEISVRFRASKTIYHRV